jgi:hypothetical protein
MPADEVPLSPADRTFLLELQRQALGYFLENQAADALFLDRQSNRGQLRKKGWCSTAATGMGLAAVALAAAPPYRLLPPAEAVQRVRGALEAALGQLRNDHGIMPHFLDTETGASVGSDALSTIDSTWLIAGGLWAAAFLRDPGLQRLANQVYERVDWHYWSRPVAPDRARLIRHGEGANGEIFAGSWDRIDGEAVHMYVLASGAAAPARSVPPACWNALKTFYGTVAGLRFNNADLGLFAFQYGLDLVDLRRWRRPGSLDLAAEAVVATRANYLFCREKSATFRTYRRFWGLSDGDGPGNPPARDAYRAYGPGAPVDGTAHLMATLAATGNLPGEVLEALRDADGDTKLGIRGRYGFSNVNLDRDWVGEDIVGIDAGAAVLALDNVLCHDRVRRVFHSLPCVIRSLDRLGFMPVEGARTDPEVAPTVEDDV